VISFYFLISSFSALPIADMMMADGFPFIELHRFVALTSAFLFSNTMVLLPLFLLVVASV